MKTKDALYTMLAIILWTLITIVLCVWTMHVTQGEVTVSEETVPVYTRDLP